eukprot:Opistho-2@34646
MLLLRLERPRDDGMDVSLHRRVCSANFVGVGASALLSSCWEPNSVAPLTEDSCDDVFMKRRLVHGVGGHCGLSGNSVALQAKTWLDTSDPTLDVDAYAESVEPSAGGDR